MNWSIPILALDSRLIDFDSELIWSVLTDVKASESWWPESLRVKITKLTSEVVGTEYKISPKNGRSFQCRIIGVFPPSKITIEYLGDFITGGGEWTLESRGSKTLVSYGFNVEAKGLLVVLIGKIISLSKIHSSLMAELLENLEAECRRRTSSLQ